MLVLRHQAVFETAMLHVRTMPKNWWGHKLLGSDNRPDEGFSLCLQPVSGDRGSVPGERGSWSGGCSQAALDSWQATWFWRTGPTFIADMGVFPEWWQVRRMGIGLLV